MGKAAEIPFNFITVSYLPPFDYEWYVDSGEFIQKEFSVIEMFRQHVKNNYQPEESDNLRIVAEDTYIMLCDDRVQVNISKESLPVRQAQLVVSSDWVDGDGNPINVGDVLNEYFDKISERLDYKVLPSMVAKRNYENNTFDILAVCSGFYGINATDHIEIYRQYRSFIELIETEFVVSRTKVFYKFTDYNNFISRLNITDDAVSSLEITKQKFMRMVNLYFSNLDY